MKTEIWYFLGNTIKERKGVKEGVGALTAY